MVDKNKTIPGKAISQFGRVMGAPAISSLGSATDYALQPSKISEAIGRRRRAGKTVPGELIKGFGNLMGAGAIVGAGDLYNKLFGKKQKPATADSTLSLKEQNITNLQNISINILNAIYKDISYIRDRISPQVLEAKQQGGSGRLMVSYDPLAPESQKFRQVEGGGALRVPKEYEKSAVMKASTLAVKQYRKEEEREKSRKKFIDPMEKEAFEKIDPISILRNDMNEKFEKVYDLLGDKNGSRFKIADIIGNLSPLAKLISKAGLVGLSGFIGYKVGEWLNEEFNLSGKITDAVFAAKDLFSEAKDKIKNKYEELTNKPIDQTAAEIIPTMSWADSEQNVFKWISQNIGAGRLYEKDREPYIQAYDELVTKSEKPFSVGEYLNYAKTKNLYAEEMLRPSSGPTRRGGRRTSGFVPMTQKSVDSVPEQESFRNIPFAEVKAGIIEGETRGISDPYNTVYGNGIFSTPEKLVGKKLTEMTMGEVQEYQKKLVVETRGKIPGAGSLGTSAVGAYQLISSTLANSAEKVFGKSWKSVKFTPETQDLLAERNYEDTKNNIETLSKQWAFFSDLSETGGAMLRAQKATGGSRRLIASSTKPNRTLNGASLNNETVELTRSAVAAPAAATPMIINQNVNQRSSPQQQLMGDIASARSTENSFNRALGRDFVHPTSTYGLVT